MELPRYLQLEPVGQCNLRCTMCAIPFRRDGPPHGPLAFMPFEAFTDIVGQFPGLEELHLQGLGEPLMHPRFFDMVSYAAVRGIHVSTNTNATLLSEPRARACVTSGLECMHISVDGATAETYESIRIRGHFDRLDRNVRRLTAAKRDLASDRPRLRLVAVVMRQNLQELPDLVRLAAEWGMEAMSVQHLCHDFSEAALPDQYRPLHDFVEAQTLLHEDGNRIDEEFAAARAMAAELGMELRLPRPRPRPHSPGTPGRERCDWPWRGAYISYDGYAMPCCMISTPDRLNLGNVGGSPIAAVWNSRAYRNFRRQLDSAAPPDICASCSVYRGTF